MSKTIPQVAFLDSAGELFFLRDSIIETEGRECVLPVLAQLFWVKVPDDYIVFSPRPGVEVSEVLSRMKDDLPLVLISSESQGKARIKLFGCGEEAEAAKAAALVKIVCGWEESELFEISSETKVYQIDARVEEKLWSAWVVSVVPLP